MGSALEGGYTLAEQIRAAFPDVRFTIEVAPVIDGYYMVVRWIANGTVRFTGSDTIRVKHGLITDYWLNADTLPSPRSASGRRRADAWPARDEPVPYSAR